MERKKQKEVGNLCPLETKEWNQASKNKKKWKNAKRAEVAKVAKATKATKVVKVIKQVKTHTINSHQKLHKEKIEENLI